MRNSALAGGSYIGHRPARRTRLALTIRTVLPLAAALLGTAACRDITSLQQSNPGQLSSATVFIPANAQLIVNSSQGDFECAYNSYIVGSGLFTDELSNAISNAGNFDIDRRTITPGSPIFTGTCVAQQAPGVYTPLAAARASNDTAVRYLQGWSDAEVPNRNRLIGIASAYAGYSLILLGEGFCSAAINLGPELTPAQLFAEAKIRFDTAIAAATRASDAQTLNLARIGRARTFLNLGNSASAAADAALVPPGFVVNIGHDATVPRRQNLVFIHTQQSNFSSVDPSIQSRFAASADPRIAVVSTGRTGSDGRTLIVYPSKFATVTAVQAVAKYSEAQLIIAENLANTGNLSGAVAIISAMRIANAQPAFDPSPLTKEAVIAQIVEERRREFFLEGHRLGDLRRYGLPPSPAAGTPYLSGGGVYSTQSCFPLPDVERTNNPNLAKP